MMKNMLVRSFIEGFKDCFRLAVCLFVGVFSIIEAFSNRSLSLHTSDEKKPNGPVSRH
jgi:hypothetical protein